MPRGVRRERNYVDEIAAFDSKIAEYEGKIKTLKAQSVFLKKEQEQSDFRDLIKILNETGLSASEVAKLAKKPEDEIA